MQKIFKVEDSYKLEDRFVVTGEVLKDIILIYDDFSYRTMDGIIKESSILGFEKLGRTGSKTAFKGEKAIGLIIDGDKADFYSGQEFYNVKKIELELYLEKNGLESIKNEDFPKKEIENLMKMDDEIRIFISNNIELVRNGYKTIIKDYNKEKEMGCKYYHILISIIQRSLNIGFKESTKIKHSIESLELVIQDFNTGELKLLPLEEFDIQIKKFYLDMTEDDVISILKKLKDKLDLGLISSEEFALKRTELLPYIKNA